jgi:hypothetical protein
MQHLYLTLDGRDLGVAMNAMWELAPRPASRWRRQALCVWLSGKLARPFVFGPIQGLKGWREAHDAAAASAQESCGLEGPCVASLESDPRTSATLATAVEAGLIEALERGARERRYRLASIRPAWALACEPTEWVAAEGAELLCVGESDALTVLAGTASQTLFAATYAPPPTDSDLNGLLQRLMVSVGVGGRPAMVRLIADAQQGKPLMRWASSIGEPSA